MAITLANLGVQYIPSTGSCMVDLAAIPPGMFNSCNAIHVRIPDEQHRIDVHSNMICIQPSQPNPAAYKEQYMYPNALPPSSTESPQGLPKDQDRRPPSFAEPDGPIWAHPPMGDANDGDGGDTGDYGSGSGPGQHDVQTEHRVDPSMTVWTRVSLAQSSFLTTFTTASTCSQATRIRESSAPFPSPFTITHTTISYSSNTPVTHIPTTTSSPSSSLQQPPIYIPSPSTITVTPSPPAERPATPTPVPLPPTQPLPSYCGMSYFKMDMTEIQTLDPHDFDLYLNLLGIVTLGLDLDHGISGLLDGLLNGIPDDDYEQTRTVHREFEHSYRVLCSVDDPNLNFGAERAERVATTSSQTGCLEECEKDAIAKARESEVRECLGAAWHRSLVRDNCRFWTGGQDEVLPMERMMEREGERGEWDLVYL